LSSPSAKQEFDDNLILAIGINFDLIENFDKFVDQTPIPPTDVQ
jgi:hypothetical protein